MFDKFKLRSRIWIWHVARACKSTYELHISPRKSIHTNNFRPFDPESQHLHFFNEGVGIIEKKEDTRGVWEMTALEKNHELFLANSINSTESLLLLPCHFLASRIWILANRHQNLDQTILRTCRFFFPVSRTGGAISVEWQNERRELKRQ